MTSRTRLMMPFVVANKDLVIPDDVAITFMIVVGVLLTLILIGGILLLILRQLGKMGDDE